MYCNMLGCCTFVFSVLQCIVVLQFSVCSLPVSQLCLHLILTSLESRRRRSPRPLTYTGWAGTSSSRPQPQRRGSLSRRQPKIHSDGIQNPPGRHDRQSKPIWSARSAVKTHLVGMVGSQNPFGRHGRQSKPTRSARSARSATL